MKINLVGADAAAIEEARSAGGYESNTTVVRQLIRFYLPDFISRFQRGIYTPLVPSEITPSAATIPADVPPDVPAKSNRPPEFL